MKIKERAFSCQLEKNFIRSTAPEYSSNNPSVELIKEKAARLAVWIFKGYPELGIASFSQIFPDAIYGQGFSKGLSIVVAYAACLENTNESAQLAEKVNSILAEYKERLINGDQKLSQLRQKADQLDNFGGYYNRKNLSEEAAFSIIPEGLNRCKIVYESSGRLVAEVNKQWYQLLLNAYQEEISLVLTEEGKKDLKLPDEIGFVTIAYKEELANFSKEEINQLVATMENISVSFYQPYMVPVRGDNRYSLVASIHVNAPSIFKIREALELPPLYSEGRPLRITFAAVHKPPMDVNDAFVEIQGSKTIKEWVELSVKK